MIKNNKNSFQASFKGQMIRRTTKFLEVSFKNSNIHVKNRIQKYFKEFLNMGKYYSVSQCYLLAVSMQSNMFNKTKSTYIIVINTFLFFANIKLLQNIRH